MSSKTESRVVKTEKQPDIYNLTEVEVLKLKNLQLQRQTLQKEFQLIIIQEEIIANQVSNRLGQNVGKWEFDLEKAVVKRK